MFLWVCLHVHICVAGEWSEYTLVDAKQVIEAETKLVSIETGKRNKVVRKRDDSEKRKRYFLLLREIDCGFTHVCRYWEQEVDWRFYDAVKLEDMIWNGKRIVPR